MNFFSWLFGYRCRCGGEFTKWERKQQEITIKTILDHSPQRATRFYQERNCKECGKVQQERLEY